MISALLFSLLMCNAYVRVCSEEKRMKLPVTFDLNEFTVVKHAIHLNPRTCTSFSVNFLQRNDYTINGDILLKVHFDRRTNCVTFQRKQNGTLAYNECYLRNEMFETRTEMRPCLAPDSMIYFTAEGDPVVYFFWDSKAYTTEVGTQIFRDTINKTLFVVVDGDAEIYGYENFHTGINLKEEGRTDEYREGKSFPVPDDFLTYQYRYYVHVRPLGWGRKQKNVVTVEVASQNESTIHAHFEARHTDVWNVVTNVMVNGKWLQTDGLIHNYFIEPGEIAQILFLFRQDVIQVFVNNDWNTTFSPINDPDTFQRIHHMKIRAENATILSQYWL